MKISKTTGRTPALAPRLSRIFVSILILTALGIPANLAGPLAISGPEGSFASPRQVAHFKVDTTFNSVGFKTDRFGHGNDAVSGAVLLPDGKVIAAIQTSEWSGTSTLAFIGVEVIRINADGTRDTTFGSTCKYVPTTYSTSFYWPVSQGLQPLLAMLPDGKIVTRVLSTIMQCNSDGSIDTSFGGGDGLISITGTLSTLTAQPDGKIVMGGQSSQNFFVVRLNPDGSYDTSFDGDGRASANLPTSAVTSLAIQADGKIVAAGSSAGDFALARFNSDGSLDTAFGNVITPILSSSDKINAMLLQPDGKILVGGTSLNSASSSSGVFALARYNADGTLDSTFDGDGKVATPVVNAGKVMLAGSIYGLSLQPDGKIVAAGQAHNDFNFDHVVSRYNSDGTLDASFGAAGFVVDPHPAAADHIDDYAKVVFVRPDGHVLVLGDKVDWRGGKDISVRQFNADGTPDITFGTAGRSELDVGKQRTITSAIAVQDDGKIVVAGSMSIGSTSGQSVRFVARYLANGDRDSSFGLDGYVLQPELIQSLAIGPGGKIIAAGFLNTTSTLVRYNSDGSVDNSFDTDGRVTLPVANSEGIEGLEFQPDGKLLYLSGTTITRLAVDGSLDPSFDGDGLVNIPGNARAFKLQADGKISVAGIDSSSNFAATRLNTDGTLDTSFDGDGIATTDIQNGDVAQMLVVQPDGKLVLGGLYNVSNGTNTAFVRYNTDGSIDTSFGTAGKTTFANTSLFTRMFLQSSGKILAVSSGGSRFLRLTASGNADTGFYGDGFSTFESSRYSSAPVPTIGATAAIDGQGNFIQAGSYQLAAGGNNDNSSLFVGKITIGDHPYVHFDHNGDGKADLGIYRPSDNTWHILTPTAYTVTAYGQAGDRPVPADYDGDGITDLSVFRPSNGRWFVRRSESQTETTTFASASSLPIPADREGDGDDNASHFFTASGGTQLFYTTPFSKPNTPTNMFFGVPGDWPIRADFNGDGRAEIALYRPSNQNWYVFDGSTGQGFYAVRWGEATDYPVPADYDGDGRTDLAVWRPSTGQWWIRQSSTGNIVVPTWGESTDKAVPADYDGDGRTDIAVWRPSTGTWYIINSADSSIRVQQFGQQGDIPLPSAFIY